MSPIATPRRHVIRRVSALGIGLALVVALFTPPTPASAMAATTLGSARSAGAPIVDPGDLGPEVVTELEYDLGDLGFQPQGFPAKVEMKAKVYTPDTIVGVAPIVIMQHGRHATCATDEVQLLTWPCPPEVPEIPSYQGYDALGRNLASHGMVVVSIGANGINANDGFLADGGASARGQLILEHLRRWQAWSVSDVGSPFGSRFVGHLDFGSVGLMGHSRGGEGIASAIQLNQRIGSPFGIRAAMALAPVDFGRRVIGGVDFGVILPYCDGDVSDLQGASYYDDGRYGSPGDPTSKSTYLLYGANHNFFNTVWTTGPGSFDDAGFFGMMDAAPARGRVPVGPVDPCQPGGASRLSAPNQEQAGATLMAAYLRRYLGPEPALARFVTGVAPYPASVGPARWSVAHHAPDRLDIATWDSPAGSRKNAFGQLVQIRGPLTGLVCNAGETSNFTGELFASPVTSCPSAEGLAATNDTPVFDVGWVRQGPVVRLPLSPAGTDVTAYDGLRLRVAVLGDSRNTARAKQDFTIVLEDTNGARASVPASTGTNGLARLNPGFVQHAVLNGLRLPVASFGSVDLTRIRAVELRLDRTGAGRLSLADLAFTQEGTGAAASQTVGAEALTPPKPLCRSTNARRWACALVQAAWGRDPAEYEIAPLAKRYASAAGRRQGIATVLANPAAAAVVHQRFAQTFVDGAADPEQLASVLSAAGHRYWESAKVDITAGFAFSVGSLNSSPQVVQAAYQTFLGRNADAAGLAFWTTRVEQGGPQKLASSLVLTATHAGRIVDERYRQILGRGPDASGRAYWVGKLAKVGGEQALVASLLATESFRAWAVH